MRWAALVATALFIVSGCSTRPKGSATLPESGAVQFIWGSAYETDFDISGFFGNDHAIGVRFMAQYERSYEGPLFATVDSATTSAYSVAIQGEALSGKMQPHISVRLAGVQHLYEVPNPVAATGPFDTNSTRAPTPPAPVWRQLFAIRRGGAVEIWLDGKKLCRKGQTATTCDLPVGTASPSGVLRLGKRPVDATKEVRNQLYGFIDDVGIFDRALSAQEVASFAPQSAGLTENTLALQAGLNFNRPAAGDGPRIKQPSTSSGMHEIVEVSAQHSSALDAVRLPVITGSAPMELPFPGGDVWEVIQEFASEGSHAAGAAFSWDFEYVPPSHMRGKPHLNGAPGEGRPFLAASDGTVVQVQQQFSANQPPNNFIVVKRRDDEFVGYLHLKRNSSKVAVGDSVPRAVQLALVSNVGSPGAHLHLAVSDRPETLAGQTFSLLVTRPSYFVDYCGSDDFGQNWTLVRIGIPRLGQWVRRMPASGVC